MIDIKFLLSKLDPKYYNDPRPVYPHYGTWELVCKKHRRDYASFELVKVINPRHQLAVKK